MQYLLDTHVLIWWITSDQRLSPKARSLITSRRNTLLWSVASSWELSIKHALGRLLFDEPPEVLIPAELDRNRIETLQITNAHAFKAGQLPAHHRDPFDRMLVAQAQIESLGIISNDSKLGLYDVDMFW
ncbi:MAG: type II toxin-antitoxin system VapC family toxin [Syntrophobacteraceae bacterium]|nr:type II toxin-antitoxin system VapC family toxin [Syntrophobacteraceae bacterium]